MDTAELLKNHKSGWLEYGRKKRSDAGVKRSEYKSILPAKYRTYVARANQKQLEFDLTIDEFEQLMSLPCVYCGDANARTIDRISSRGGYTKDNTQSCCYMCNMMKHLFESESFVSQVKKISRYLAR